MQGELCPPWQTLRDYRTGRSMRCSPGPQCHSATCPSPTLPVVFCHALIGSGLLTLSYLPLARPVPQAQLEPPCPLPPQHTSLTLLLHPIEKSKDRGSNTVGARLSRVEDKVGSSVLPFSSGGQQSIDPGGHHPQSQPSGPPRAAPHCPALS